MSRVITKTRTGNIISDEELGIKSIMDKRCIYRPRWGIVLYS